MTGYLIRRAQLTDVPAMIALRREAEQWLARQGIEQWTGKWVAVADEKVERAARQERSWVVDIDGDLGATITLGGPDEDLWRIEDGPGLYMYKLIVARRHTARSLGAMITNWACDKAARFGYPWLRLDAWPTNSRLVDYYRNQGFTHVRTVHVPGRDTGVLMQRPAKITPTPRLSEEMTEAISPAD